MNTDLDETLKELGPEYRAVVARLRAGAEAESIGIIGGRRGPTAVWLSGLPLSLVAASLAVLLGLAAVFVLAGRGSTGRAGGFRSAPREYAMTVAEMVATQKPDGSWANDFLTRRNAEALRQCTDTASRTAYKKAMRNLRLRGLL